MRYFNRIIGVVALLCVALVGCRQDNRDAPATAGRSANLYVSPQGDDRWSGLLPEPNEAHTDGPVATLEVARDRARLYAAYPRTIWIRGGVYIRQQPFALSKEDGGTASATVTYSAYHDERVLVRGGVTVGPFKKVDDPFVLNRLEPV